MLIEKGLVKVNGTPVTEPGYKIKPREDQVTIHGEKIVIRLLNRSREVTALQEIGMGPREETLTQIGERRILAIYLLMGVTVVVALVGVGLIVSGGKR